MRLIDADALNGYKFGLISPYAQNLFHKTINEAPTIVQEPKTDTLDRIKAEIADIYCGQYCENPLTADAVREMALEIIDKYKAEMQ